MNVSHQFACDVGAFVGEQQGRHGLDAAAASSALFGIGCAALLLEGRSVEHVRAAFEAALTAAQMAVPQAEALIAAHDRNGAS
jgi:hypothetical protein